MRNVVLATLTALTLAAPLPALAQPAPSPAPALPAPPPAEPSPQAAPPEDPVVEYGDRTGAPNTDSCPNALEPPKPKIPAPNPKAAPAPLPVVVPGNCGFNLPDQFAMPQGIFAASWIVFDIDSGDVIASKDPHGRYRPANIMSVLLAMVAIRELDFNQEVIGSEAAANAPGTTVGMGPQGRYKVRDLLAGLLLNNGNDTAIALSEALGGTEVALAKVNDLAAEIGSVDTRVLDVAGRDVKGQSTSVHDLARFYRVAWKTPSFTKLSTTKSYLFPGYADRPAFEIGNDNEMLSADPASMGGNTGFTDNANATYAGAMNRNGRRLGVIILDTTPSPLMAWEQGKALLDAAYATPVGVHMSNLDEGPGAGSASVGAQGAPQNEAAGPTSSSEAVADSEEAAEQQSSSPGWRAVGIFVIAIALLATGLALGFRMRELERRSRRKKNARKEQDIT